VLLTEFFTV